jgi:hypothetical protein
MQEPKDTTLLEDDYVDTFMPTFTNEKGVRAWYFLQKKLMKKYQVYKETIFHENTRK